MSRDKSPMRVEVDRIARVLIAEWERVEGKVGVSYVANFADMARAVIFAQPKRPLDLTALPSEPAPTVDREETFEDELDDHIIESLADPKYARAHLAAEERGRAEVAVKALTDQREELAQEIEAERDDCVATLDDQQMYDRGVLYGLSVAQHIVRTHGTGA